MASKKSTTVVIPANLPGKAEAEQIRTAYELSLRGLRATVALGLFVWAAKERLPHGQFMPWLQANCPTVSYHTANRAMVCAKAVFEQVLFAPSAATLGSLQQLATAKFSNLRNLAEEPLATADVATVAAEALIGLPDGSPHAELVCGVVDDFVDGKSRTHLLLLAREEELDDHEAEQKRKCEEIWATDPKARDEWEPRVLAGELKYGEALKGMLGQRFTAGKQRNDPDYSRLFRTSLKTLRTGLQAGKWSELDAPVKKEVIDLLTEVFPLLPPEVRSRLK